MKSKQAAKVTHLDWSVLLGSSLYINEPQYDALYAL